ncbi:TPA: hypothetical protein DDZ86_05155 [Candidatus Dependentiae bacterium]|nr:hypothetical protein [Candidatus Dependentiae bacterium]
MKYIQKLSLILTLLCTYAPSLSAGILHDLISQNNVAEIKIFLKNKDEKAVNTKDDCNKTPLHLACSYNQLDIVKLLIDKGADVNITDAKRFTSLYWACVLNHLDIVKLLLEKSINISIAEQNGWTPLSWACSKGCEDIIKLLLEKGADATFKPKNSEAPISLICSKKWTTEHRKTLLKSLILTKRPLNKTTKQLNARLFAKLVISKLAAQMQNKSTIAPKIPKNDDLFKSPLIKNPEQEIACIEEIIKIWLFESHKKQYTWLDETTNLNKFKLICPYDCQYSPSTLRIKINFGINCSQYLFLRTLQNMACLAIVQPKAIKCNSSSTSSTENRHSKLCDIIIKCRKPSSTE